MTDKDKLDYLEYIKDFMDEAAKAYIRGDDDAYIGALNSADALLTGLLNDDDEEAKNEVQRLRRPTGASPPFDRSRDLLRSRCP